MRATRTGRLGGGRGVAGRGGHINEVKKKSTKTVKNVQRSRTRLRKYVFKRKKRNKTSKKPVGDETLRAQTTA